MLMLLKSSEILVKVRCEANNIHPFRACNEHGQHFYFCCCVRPINRVQLMPYKIWFVCQMPFVCSILLLYVLTTYHTYWKDT